MRKMSKERKKKKEGGWSKGRGRTERQMEIRVIRRRKKGQEGGRKVK